MYANTHIGASSLAVLCSPATYLYSINNNRLKFAEILRGVKFRGLYLLNMAEM